jgi:hypothetical protein
MYKAIQIVDIVGIDTVELLHYSFSEMASILTLIKGKQGTSFTSRQIECWWVIRLS